MELTVKILIGKRKGQSFPLPSINLFFYENEALEFTFISNVKHNHVSIFFHEVELQCTNCQELASDKFEYVWRPKKSFHYGYECLFHNYFGVAELTLVIDGCEKNTYQMEILASKINTYRTEKMLSFLINQDNNILWSFLRATRINSGKIVGDNSVDHSIERLEATVRHIESLLNQIVNKPIVKVVPQTYYTDPKNSHSIDDETLAWLSNNIDMLYEIDNETDALIYLEDKFYSINTLKTNILVNDTNVYENQVLHGFIHRLKLDTKYLIEKLEASPNNNNSNYSDLEYESLFNLLNKMSKKINANKIKKCININNRLDFLLHRLNKFIPTKSIYKNSPIFTPKVKHNYLYLSYFKKIIEWDKAGKTDWSITEELFAIKNIPLLFEYYLFFYIKKILESSLGNAELINYNHSDISFAFEMGAEQFSLVYQPKFWVKSHKESNSFNLINSEKWFITKNNKLREKSATFKYSMRSPDIMLIHFGSSKNITCFIIDAKYTGEDKGFTHYLPELTLKYLHGIHHQDSGYNSSVGLMIVNPTEEESIKHFHHDDYNIFSNSPIYPALICSSISINDDLSPSKFSELINRIALIMRNSPTSDN